MKNFSNCENDWLETYIKENVEKAIDSKLIQMPPEEELHHEFSPEFEKKMEDLIQQEKKFGFRRKIVRNIKNTAAVLLLFCIVGFGLTMSVEAYRERFVNFIIKTSDQCTDITINSNFSIDENQDFTEPSKLPDGYHETDRCRTENQLTITYQDTDDNFILYSQDILLPGNLCIDTEDVIIKQLAIDNLTVYLIYKNDRVRIYWQDEQYLFYLSGPEDLEDELLNIVNSIINR